MCAAAGGGIWGKMETGTIEMWWEEGGRGRQRTILKLLVNAPRLMLKPPNPSSSVICHLNPNP